MNLEFAYNTGLVKKVAGAQLVLDKEFARESLGLRGKLYTKKISGADFWAQYKKALLESVGKNKAALQSIFRKLDPEMRERIKEAEQTEKTEKKPPLDLRLPE